MANAPENNMDQRLKTYAQQRREEAGRAHEMPAATRHMLQAEVARTFRENPEAPARVRFFFGFWPRLALGCGLIGVLAVTAVVSMKTGRKMQQRLELAEKLESDRLAPIAPSTPLSDQQANARETIASRNDAPISALETPQPTAREIAPTPAPVAGDGRGRASGEEKTVRLANLPATPAAATDSIRVVTPLGQSQSASRSDRDADMANSALKSDKSSALAPKDSLAVRRSNLAVNTTSVGAEAKKAESTGQALYFQTQQSRGLAEKDSNAQRLQFNQIDSRARFRLNRNSPPIPNVLTSFQIQRQGNNVVVFDADGSVYEGTVQSLPQAGLGVPGLVAMKEEKAKAVQSIQTRLEASDDQFKNQALTVRNGAEPQAGDNFSFYAVGTNRSLNQRVVFSGNYLNFNNTLSPGGAGFGGGGFEGVRGSPTFSQVPQSNARVSSQSAVSKGLSPSSQTGAQSSTRPAMLGGGPNQQLQVLQGERVEGKASVGKTEFPIEALRVSPKP